MKSLEFKKVLIVIDKKENAIHTIEELKECLQQDEDIYLNNEEIDTVIQYLLDNNCIQIHHYIELKAPITLYARSKHNSLCESIWVLSIFLFLSGVDYFHVTPYLLNLLIS